MAMEKNTCSLPWPPPPPWEVLSLVVPHLDPKTLAIASCVSKSWSLSMSSDHLWKSIFNAHFPSLSSLKLANPSVPYIRLFAVGHSAAKLRHRTPAKPTISLSDLVFSITVSTAESDVVVLAAVRFVDRLAVDPPHGVFRFDIDVGDDESRYVSEGSEEVRFSWNVVLKGWRGVFTMMDRRGKVEFRAGGEGWFSEVLPAAGCCLNAAASATEADLKLVMCGDEKRARVKTVSVGILSVAEWRYAGVEDSLRYLQHFLLTSN